MIEKRPEPSTDMNTMVTLSVPKNVVVRVARLVPSAPADKVERHLVTEAMVAEVVRALNAFAYGEV